MQPSEGLPAISMQSLLVDDKYDLMQDLIINTREGCKKKTKHKWDILPSNKQNAFAKLIKGFDQNIIKFRFKV